MKRILIILVAAITGLTTVAFTVGPDRDKYFEIMKNIEIFTNLYREVNTSYVDDIDPGQLMRTGLEAMVGSLDPYTNYISESDIEGYRFQVEGKYHGIGAISQQIDDYVTITEIYKDQPADEAGLKPGDQIVAVDGQPARGRSVEELNEIMRGFPGTTMKLTINRPGQQENLMVELTRGEVEVPNVPYYGMVDGDVGYVNLTTFTRDAARNVRKAVAELRRENPGIKGVIVDLRGNGGGLLNEAVDIVNIFVPQDEVVVSTRGKVKEWDRSYKTQGSPLDTEIPVAVLINKRSASASEIVSGALQDLDRAVVIGQRSYGKGLVQNVMEVGYNARVKITTAKYYIPSQRCIQSVEYQNGEPVDIPDAQRGRFRTRAGRTVLDGGGVTPDISLDLAADEGIVKALVDNHLIFKYVTDWSLRHPTIDSVADFRFTDFADFERFLKQSDFTYNSESEELLLQAMEEAKEEGVDIAGDLAAVQQRINAAQASELQRHREELIDMIEKEIAGRYFYERGRVQMGLRNDQEIREAVSILNDQKKYKTILQPR